MTKLKTRTNQPVEDTEGLLNHLSQNGNTTEIDGDLKVNGNTFNDLTNFLDLEPYVQSNNDNTKTNKYWNGLEVRRVVKGTFDMTQLKYNDFMLIMQKNNKYKCNSYNFIGIKYFDEYGVIAEELETYIGGPFLILECSYIKELGSGGTINYDIFTQIVFLKDNEGNVYFTYSEM